MKIPNTNDSLVIRTDYSDDAAWDALCAAIRAPTPVDGFQAHVAFVSDPSLDGADVARVMELVPSDLGRSFIFVVDRVALDHPEHPILVVDLADLPGRTFRVVPSEAWGVENNLSLSNMDFHEFAESVGADGVFRGF